MTNNIKGPQDWLGDEGLEKERKTANDEIKNSFRPLEKKPKMNWRNGKSTCKMGR